MRPYTEYFFFPWTPNNWKSSGNDTLDREYSDKKAKEIQVLLQPKCKGNLELSLLIT